MTVERTRVVWLESRSDYSTGETAELSGLPAALLDELVAVGALPVAEDRTVVRFQAEGVVLARAARRLREHFELDESGLAVAVALLRRVRMLEAELSRLRAHATPGSD